MNSEGHKKCSTCRKIKPLSEYYGDKRRKDGLQCQCKSCLKKSAKEGQRKYAESGRKNKKISERADRYDKERVEIDGKVCPVCGIWKPRSDYRLNRYREDGLWNFCKACFNERYGNKRKEYNVKYNSNPEVKERNRARNLEYHHKHKDEINRKDRERVKKLRESSPEILKAERQVQWERDVKRVGRDEINRKMREWRKNNPEKCKEYGRRQRSKGNDRAYYYQYKWRKLNRDKFLGSLRVRSARRKALKNNNGGEFTQQEWTDLCNKYGNICLCCGKKKKLTADHIIPLSLGGTSNIDNIQPLCQSCNSKKRVRIIDYRPDFKGVQ